MATTNDAVQAPSQLATLQGLMALLGGGGTGTTTTSPGDTTALQQLIAQLQGANYQGLLESVFQQAAGSIPKLQAAYGNAVGARSGNNSATAAALQELLKATTIEAQGQLANQQLQNQQIQANAGGSIAQATKGQTQTNKANTLTGSGLGDLAAMIALMKGAQTLTGSKSVDEMLGKVTGVNTVAPAPAVAPVSDAVAAPVQSNITTPTNYSIAPTGGSGGLSFGGVSSAPVVGNSQYSLVPETGNIGGGIGFNAPAFNAADYQIGSYDYGLIPQDHSSVGLQAPTFDPAQFEFGASDMYKLIPDDYNSQGLDLEWWY